MDIILNGYFDKNFGDDLMQQIVVEAFPEHMFYVVSAEREMVSHLEKYDNVCINGKIPTNSLYLNVIGTGFMYAGKRAKAEKLINMLVTKNKRYPKSMLINCSLEKFDGKLAEKFALSDLKEYDLITCRDSVSYKYLSQKFPKKKVEMFSDLVFEGKFAGADAAGTLLGVAPVRRMYSGDNYEYYKNLAQFCDNYVQENDTSVLLFAFDNGLENDVSAAASVKTMMKNKDRAEIIAYCGNTDEIVANMQRCNLLVGSRFHSIVLAKCLNIKCVAISDREKLNRLCEDVNIPVIPKEQFVCSVLENIIKTGNIKLDYLKAEQGHLSALKNFIE